MILINFNNTHASFSDLVGDENLVPAIEFVKQWNNGANHFTFQSSGSTGIAKDIVLSKNFLIQSAQRTIDLFQIKPEDHLLLALNTSFIGGMMMIVRALVAQCTLVYIAPQQISIETLHSLPPIKLASFVPVQIKKLLEQTEKDPFIHIAHVIIGGAPMHERLVKEISALKTPCLFYQTYGMTETASHVALKNISKNELHYTALNGYSFETNNNDQLIIQYLQHPTFTIQTNDMVNLISSQSFQWIGRADWVVNSGGIKFNLETAEDIVADFFKQCNHAPLITSYKTGDEQWGERWILILACDPLTPEKEDALCNFCKQHLGKYAYPKEIRYSNKTVYLPSGKIDRMNTYKASL